MIHHRTFKSYTEYRVVQGHKAENHAQYVKDGEESREAAFKVYLGILKESLMPGKVLCMGARTGTEVRVFQKMKFRKSVGVDLWPLDEKVIKADWEDTPFENNSFQNVFTNSLDHCQNFKTFIKEVRRVLVPNGVFTFITDANYALGKRGIDFEHIISNNINLLNAMFWDRIEDVLNALDTYGFSLTFFKNKNNRILVSCRKEAV